MPLVTRTSNTGNLITQDTDPGAVGAGSLWSEIDAEITSRRNDADSAWVRMPLSGGIAISDLADAIDGELITWAADATPAAVAVGTVGQVLTSGGAGVAPTFQDAAGILSVIETYEASVAEAAKTFTFTAVDFDDDSELLLVMDFNVAGAGVLSMAYNGITGTAYAIDGRAIKAGVETLIDLNAQAAIQIASSALLTDAEDEAFLIVHIGLSKASATIKRIISFCEANGPQQSYEATAGHNNTTSTSISSIEITSTVNWNIGSRMTLYKLARA